MSPRAAKIRGAAVFLAAALLPLSPPKSAGAAEPSPSIRGLKIVVPDARGNASGGRAPLIRAVRRTLAEGVGPLIPSRQLALAQRKLKKAKGRKLYAPEVLAEAARSIGAQYVLDVEITRQKWLYTAHAVLINVETGETQMDFRSQYFKPKTEAEDRGRRIGSRTIAKLEQLAEAGPPPMARAPKPSGNEPGDGPERRDPAALEPEGRVPLSGAEADSDATEGRVGSLVLGGASPGADATRGRPGSVAPVAPPEARSPVDPSPDAADYVRKPSSLGGAGGREEGGMVAVVRPREERAEEEESSEFLRISVSGGAGLLHTYDLSSATVPSSRLSYRLDPIAMLSGEIELIIPSVSLGIIARSCYRPVRFQISVDAVNAQEPEGEGGTTPAGSFLDAAGLLAFHIDVAGSGREAFKLISALGVRLDLIKVARHPGDLILSSTSIAPVGSLELRMPFNDVLEVGLGIDGGPILSYDETPFTGGNPDGGLILGGNLKARVWLSSAIAIAFDTRFDLEHVAFTGAPTRILPANEDLENVSSTTKDLRTGVGVALRL